ncbi:MAG: cytochrome P460 family protein [Nitrospira sp.]|nr:cytochrome P460 family protein [Nitrospira sp.]
MPVSDRVASPRRTTILGTPQDQTALNVAVVRLLALALNISGGWSPAPPASGLLIPFGYRDWPTLTSVVKSPAGAQQLRFYVCPKALLTADDRSFPVGTVFIVESEPYPSEAAGCGSSLSIFVMEKCAGMTVEGAAARQSESWMYASWDSGGQSAGADPGRCGICRLPWLTPASA